MVQSVKATYRDGVLEPSESLDLEDGDVVTLSISEVNGAGDDEDYRVGVGWRERSVRIPPIARESRQREPQKRNIRCFA